MEVKEIRCEEQRWMKLAHVGDKWRGLVWLVLKHWVRCSSHAAVGVR